MKCIALKIDGNKRKNLTTILLGIIVIIVGLMSIISCTWYSILFCTLVGGGYIIWSGYLEMHVKKELENSDITKTMNVKYCDKGQYLLMEYEQDE